MPKPILCLDFDGVLHSYESGWQGADIIPDMPVPGAIKFVLKALDHFDVQIFSSRSHQENGILAMRSWLQLHLINEAGLTQAEAMNIAINRIGWPVHKPSAMVTIDDRALPFTGVFPAIEQLTSFQPWNYHLRHPK